MISAIDVIIIEIKTVFFLPMLSITTAEGIEKIANHKNTIIGIRLAVKLLRLKSFLIKFVATPTKSTIPIVKKQSIKTTNEDFMDFELFISSKIRHAQKLLM